MFAPGRVNVIGEHTDYNKGLALPFAITDGVRVRASTNEPAPDGTLFVEAIARELGESDRFALENPEPATGWKAFVRGAVAELQDAGFPLAGAKLEISGELAQGAGLSSSAALTVALCMALLELDSGEQQRGELSIDRIALARICSKIENDWAGAQTGLLDQIASLCGASDTALRIDFQSLEVTPVPLRLEGWRFAISDSGERHVHASSGYNERRAECARACELLGIDSLREAHLDGLDRLPESLHRRARHVLEENDRVQATVVALGERRLDVVAEQLNASHESLRDLYQVSTPAVEATVDRLTRAGASGARLIGGGFGGSVLGLFAPDVALPPDTIEVTPGPGAHVLAN